MAKKKKISWQSCLVMLMYIALGFFAGICFGRFIAGRDMGDLIFLYYLIFVLSIYAFMLLQIIVHEAGHLVFGLLSGYKFSSFRIGSVIFVKNDEKIKIKRYSLAGTAGQCLMTPPKAHDGKIPYVLYNLGGSLFNFISGSISLVLYLVLPETSFIAFLAGMNTGWAYLMALSNGIPLKLGLVNNDGHNVFSLGKNEAALKAFENQFRINDLVTRGVRLKDMPAALFELPAMEDMNNSLVSAGAVFTCNRLMDEHRFEEAKTLMEAMLRNASELVGIYKNLLICDIIFCELIENGDKEKVKRLFDKKQQKFMASMAKNPSVIRTQYAYYSLCENDREKANGYKMQFEKTALSYPYSAEIESERELIELADSQKEVL